MNDDVLARLKERMAQMEAASAAADASQVAAFEPRHVAMWTRHSAVGYMRAADQIVPAQGTQEPKYFLYCHAIELALKAYLLVNEHTERDCAKLSHDIAAALRLAKTHELAVSDWHTDIVASLSREHNRPFSFRYFNKLGWGAPSFDNVSDCCKDLIKAVQVKVFAASNVPLWAEHLALDL
jgi:hypothetical protein